MQTNKRNWFWWKKKKNRHRCQTAETTTPLFFFITSDLGQTKTSPAPCSDWEITAVMILISPLRLTWPFSLQHPAQTHCLWLKPVLFAKVAISLTCIHPVFSYRLMDQYQIEQFVNAFARGLQAEHQRAVGWWVLPQLYSPLTFPRWRQKDEFGSTCVLNYVRVPTFLRDCVLLWICGVYLLES